MNRSSLICGLLSLERRDLGVGTKKQVSLRARTLGQALQFYFRRHPEVIRKEREA